MLKVFLCDIHTRHMKCHIGKSVKVISSAPERWNEWDPANPRRECDCTTHPAKLLHRGGERLERVSVCTGLKPGMSLSKSILISWHPALYYFQSWFLCSEELMLSQSNYRMAASHKHIIKSAVVRWLKVSFFTFYFISLFYFTPSSSLSGFLGGFWTVMHIAWF